VLDFDFIDWDDEDDPAGNVWHIASAGLTPDEVEDVLRAPDPDSSVSRSSRRLAVFGRTGTGKYIIVVYEITREGGVTVIRPRTAYEVPPP
jgi:uncharacterized DUF497 family protein